MKVFCCNGWSLADRLTLSCNFDYHWLKYTNIFNKPNKQWHDDKLLKIFFTFFSTYFKYCNISDLKICYKWSLSRLIKFLVPVVISRSTTWFFPQPVGFWAQLWELPLTASYLLMFPVKLTLCTYSFSEKQVTNDQCFFFLRPDSVKPLSKRQVKKTETR